MFSLIALVLFTGHISAQIYRKLLALSTVDKPAYPNPHCVRDEVWNVCFDPIRVPGTPTTTMEVNLQLRLDAEWFHDVTLYVTAAGAEWTDRAQGKLQALIARDFGGWEVGPIYELYPIPETVDVDVIPF